MAMTIEFLFLLCLLLAIASIVLYTLLYGISPMPSSRKAIAAIVAAIPSDIEGKVYELGSGWGNLAFALARRLPHCQIVGYEISPIPWLFSKGWQLFAKEKNVQFIRADFFRQPLSDSSLIVCYLYPKAMIKLKEKLEREEGRNALLIANTFAIPGWMPKQIIAVQDFYHTKIYVY